MKTTQTFYWHNLVSHIVRFQIKTGRLIFGSNALILIIPLRLNSWKELWHWGPSFSYKGDEVVWSWRKKNWTSVCCEGVFPSLKAVDDFWKEYECRCNNE